MISSRNRKRAYQRNVVAQLGPQAKRKRKYSKREEELIQKAVLAPALIVDWDNPLDVSWMRRMWRTVILPPPKLTISDYADAYRKITPEFSAESGQWFTARFEPMREVMDCCSPHSRYRRVVLVKPVQSGGTEACVLNPIAYYMDMMPRSMLVVFPTVDTSESFSKERLDPMIEAMPSLSEKVIEMKSVVTRAGKGSSVRKKRYPGGFANFVGANSASGLSSRPVPVVIVDEVDLCIKNASKRGNPVKLALGRTTTFFDKKEILLSSPLCEEGESGIIPFWEEGSRAKLYRECPNVYCRHYQVLEFERMDFDSAMLACEKCGNYYPQWKWQTGEFKWIHEIPDHNSIASFWLTGLDSPWLDWQIDVIDDYNNCQKMIDNGGDDSQMKVFVNSKLTKYYRKKGKGVDIDLYHERREVYQCHLHNAEVPDGVILITVGVDVQDTWIVYDAVGWGRGRESWMLEHGEFQGDPRSPDSGVWDQLDRFAYRRVWRLADGSYMRTRCMFVDSGWVADEVYKYTRPRHPRVFAIKGVGGCDQPIIVGAGSKRKRRVVEGVWLVRIGKDSIRDEFHTRMAVTNPGPGYCHWPMQENGMDVCGYNMEYFDEIMAEEKQLIYNKAGFKEWKWEKNRTDQNEAMSCQVSARAALEYLKVRLEQMPKDVAQVDSTAIETVSVGVNQTISMVVKSEVRKANKTPTQRYGTTSTSIPSFPQERARTNRGGYGAMGDTSF